ncbi:pimeloyl-ACP methyl ester esterase BioH [Pontibacter sp. JAM-7]|uniref:pimeloyl-ACP methyl ester esterase BioH n=1 Tax=Pontibacter sp. JAM-7 TaxID=3366581 RepID=UPI003AF67F6A
MSLYTQHIPNPGMPELVLLHGWGMSSDVWQPVLPQLASRYSLTLIDLPGLGRSARTASCHLAEIIDALLTAAPEQACWLGWSLGGQLAVECATQAPDRVKGIITVASSPCFVERDDWQCAMQEAVFAGFESALLENPKKTLSRFMMLQTQGAEAGRENLKFLRALQPNLEHAALSETLQLLRLDSRGQLAGLQQPIMQIFGERDQLIPQSAAQACAELTGRFVQLYSGAGHLPFLSHPEMFCSDLQQFMESSVG